MLRMELVTHNDIVPKAPSAVIKFTPNDSDVPYDDAPVFDISTYRKVTTNAFTIASICDLNNRFFDTLPYKDQLELYDYFKMMRRYLSDLDARNLTTIIREMTNFTETTFFKLDIPAKLIQFVIDIGVKFPTSEHKEMRVQDTVEKTFHVHEYVEITAISILSKILCPVLGQCINLMRPPITDKDNKEYFTFTLFQPILMAECSPFKKVCDKLMFYLEDTIRSTLNSAGSNPNNAHSSLTFVMTENGFCDQRFLDLICAVIMAKKLVSFDIFKNETPGKIPNIITYIYSVVSETSGSKLSTIQSGTTHMPRFDPTDGGNQEDNTTQLENTARISKVSFDIPIMAEAAVEIEIPRILEEYGLSQEMFNRAETYYIRNLIQPSTFNRALISSLLGRRMGGSKMLQYYRMSWYAKLLVASQLILLKRGYWNLAVLLSCTTSPQPITEPLTTAALRVASNYNKTIEYLEAARLFPGFSEKIIDTRSESGRRVQETEYINFDAQLGRLLSWIKDYRHFYNLPPFMWKMNTEDFGGNRPVQGDVIELKETIMRELCAFFKECHQPPTPA